MDLVEKNARGRSKDPVQENLKEHKSTWNEKTSKFITLLIALKQGLNGKPVPALNIPAGRLHDPIPDSVIGLLDQMAGIYEELTQTAKQIVQEQQSHAEQVGQRREQKQQSPTLASKESTEIIKEASNVLTRLWTYISTPFNFSDEDKWIRVNLLQNLARIHRILKEIRENLATRSENTIPHAVYLTKDLIHNFLVTIVSPLNQWYRKRGPPAERAYISKDLKDQKVVPQDYVTEMRENAKEMGKHHEELFRLTNGIQDADIRDQFYLLLKEFSSVVPLFWASYNRGDFERMQEHYSRMVEKIQYADRIIKEYRQEVSKSRIEDIDTAAMAKKKIDIEKLAQSRMKTWILRNWLSLWSSRDSSLRNGALSITDQMEKSLDKMMTILQSSDMELSKFVIEVQNFINSTASYMVFLASLSDAHNNRVGMVGKTNRDNKERLIPESEIRILRRLRIRLEISLDIADKKE